MKRTLLTLAFSLSLLSISAQLRFPPLTEWDYTAYCSYNHRHPMKAVKADNNWQLLWELRTAATVQELSGRGIACTQSQFMLLSDEGLIERTDSGRWKTAIPILDSTKVAALREEAVATASRMLVDMNNALKEFSTLLSHKGFQTNAFSILFSHILDGAIWDEFERNKIIGKLPEHSGWSGYLWFCHPKNSAFSSGTNSLPLGARHTLHICWAENDPDFTNLIYQQKVLDALTEILHRGWSSGNGMAVIHELGLLDETGQLKIPILRQKGTLGHSIRQLTRDLCRFYIRHTDTQRIKTLTGSDDTPLATMIFYHEVMWELSRQLLDRQFITLPIIFADPIRAEARDMASVCFITKN